MKQFLAIASCFWGAIFYQNPVYCQVSEAFIHVADQSNIFSNTTRIDHLGLNQNPNAMPVFVHRYNVGNAHVNYVNKKLGLWYHVPSNKWTIFNQDQSAFTSNSAYNVLIPGPDINVFKHTTANNNITSDYTVLDHPSINNNPNVVMVVSDVYGTYHLQSVGLYYNNTSQRWRLFNLNGDNMNPNKSFHIVVAINGQQNYGALRHTSEASNITSNRTRITNPNLDDNPNALIFVTQVWPPAGAKNNNHVGVYYASGKWQIYNEDNTKAMPANAAFNVIYFPNNSTVSIAEQQESEARMTVFPNPLATGNTLAITLNKAHQGDVTVKMYSLTGQLVHHTVLSKSTTDETFVCALPTVQRGLYMLHAESKGAISIQKLIIK